jgi:tRNA(His) 5'-end guanylyltransferase
MNAAAQAVLKEAPDIVIAYGISDEYRCFFTSQTLLQQPSLHVSRFQLRFP